MRERGDGTMYSVDAGQHCQLASQLKQIQSVENKEEEQGDPYEEATHKVMKRYLCVGSSLFFI